MKSAPSSAPSRAAKATASGPRSSGGESKPPGTISAITGRSDRWASLMVRARLRSVAASAGEPGKAVTARASAPTRRASSTPKNCPTEPLLGVPRLLSEPSLRRMSPTPSSSAENLAAIP